MRRAQSALEFSLITVAMLIIFATAIIVIEQKALDITEQRTDEVVYELIQTLQAEFQLAYEAGEGYDRIIYVPRSLAGEPYSITYNQNTTPEGRDEIVVIAHQREYLDFLTVDVNGTLMKGYVQLKGGSPVQLTPT